MEQTSFDFDQAIIEDAVVRIQNATNYVSSLGGFLPKDLKGFGLLRQQVEELRRGLIVLTGLADALAHLHDEQTAHSRALAWASRLPSRHKPG